MFLHLGSDFFVCVSEVISVQDYKCLTETEAKEKTENVSDGKIKSVVVTDNKIYFSKLSPGTLKKRVEDFGS